MLESARILIVDDERVVRDGCARILSREGHEVSTAPDGPAGLDLIREQAFDLLLLDIKMPGLDGMQVMNTLRHEERNLLTLVVTGFASVAMAVEAMKGGAYDLLLKPFSADALRISVNRALAHIRLTREAEELRHKQARSLRDIATEQSRIRTIMNSMACGVLVTDNEQNLVLFNPMGHRMLGLAPDEINGRPVTETMADSGIAALIQKLFEPESAYLSLLEQEIDNKKGMHIRARTAPVRDPDYNMLGTVTVLQDITALKKMDKMKSEFVAMVAHELKAPLAVIHQQMEVLLEGMAGEIGSKQAHLLARARDRAEGLMILVDDLLDISRIESGLLVSRQTPTDIVPIIEQAVEFMAPQARARQQSIITEIPAFLPEVSADANLIDQVFLNLISNAIKYTPDGGRIEIKATVAGAHVRIQIKDTGHGISSEDIPRIFDKFFRAKNDKTKGISGTGLGMSITKAIVDAHLGAISVDSRMRQGTTVTIELPLLKPTGVN